ncbi:aminotransferase class IV family protein [Micromonospora sp. CPCC 206061]|uniref:aminotransferase class IV family protein n=1 Tax=Micromonospora sp. CPCC 206061 TaxID=3122410 RepID=UPI002FEEBEBF
MELDGRSVTAEELAALALYNYGHFTTMRVDGGRVRGLSLHLRRLVSDCRTVFDAELDPVTVRRLVRRACGERSTMVRVTVFAPDLDLARPARPAEPHLLVTTRPVQDHELPPLRLRTARHERDEPGVKHVGLFAAVRQRRIAQRSGFDDVLFVDRHGNVSEGATWNVGFFDGERLVWPAAQHLPGVTMALLRSLGRAESTREVDLASAASMPAAFVTNAAIGVRPVGQIDQTTYLGEAEIVQDLRAAYLAIPGEEL